MTAPKRVYKLTVATAVLILQTLIALAQSVTANRVYELNIDVPSKQIRSDKLRLGGTNPNGETIAVNNFYMSIKGRPVIPVTGEF